MTSAIVTKNSELAVRVRQLESTNQHQHSRIQHLEARNHELESQLNWLKEQFKLARHREFGSSSEKIALQSELLFNEAEATVDAAPVEPEPETVTYVRKRKSAGHREEILAKLPIEVIEHRLAEDEQVCSQCGNAMHEMSTQTRDELVIIPAQVKVNRHVRYVYS